MAIHRLNHAVLYIRDLERSTRFYCDVLGFVEVMSLPGQAAFLRAPGSTNDHDLGLFSIGKDAASSPAGRSTVGLYHLAWEVDTLADLRALELALAAAGALVGATDHGPTKSLYAHDPDGLEFEVVWLVPAHLLTEEIAASTGIRPLDLNGEIERFGEATRGGLGISVPLGVERPLKPVEQP
ncbi:MAG: VOC family protein [Nocardioidaceae bacterium]